MQFKRTIKRFFSAPTAKGLCGARRGAMMLLATLLLTLTAQTAWAGDYDDLYAEVSGSTMTLKCAATGTISTDETASPKIYKFNGNWQWISNFKNAVTTVNIDAETCSNYTGTTLSALFYGLKNVTAINGLASLRTDDVTNMNSVFLNCNKVTALDISGWDTEGVTTMESMFYECHSLTALDLSAWKTASVTTMNTMFYNCYNLATLDITDFNTASVTDMYGMFYGCNNLTTLDIASFNTANVTTMGSMFRDCPRLVSILIGPDWQPTTGSKGMFYGCSSLVGDTGTKCSVTSADTEDYTHAHWGSGGYMSAKWMNNTLYADVSSDGKTMTLKCSNHFTPADNRYQYAGSWGITSTNKAGITTINIEGSCANYTGTMMQSLFNGFKNATAINGLADLRTADVTNMNSMFSECSNLTTLDISGWNTDEVTSMSGMFYRCSSLTTLDLSAWTTTSVTTMKSMFMSCSNLTMLDLSTWNTGIVTNMYLMFSGCSNLTLLDLAGWNTGSVTEMQEMFKDCSSLETIIVGSGWTTAAVTSSNYMFYNCTALVGGKGTTFSASYDNKTRAVADGLNSQSGYLTGEYTLFNTGDDATNAYVIDSKVLFNLFSRRVNGGNSYQGKYFKLGDDLSYTKATANNFTPIGTESNPFSGTFDGNKKTISGINISLGSTDYVGLFGYANGATIKNLKLDNSTITGKEKVGGITGIAGGTKIANCLVTNGVDVSGAYYAGGVSGMSGQISGCKSAANVSATSSYAGGIVGYINGQYSNSIDHCLYTGNTVTGNSNGAIVGSTINPSSATMNYNYYTADLNIGGCNGADTDGARKAVKVTVASGVTLTPAGDNDATQYTEYNLSGIVAFYQAGGIGYGGNWYAGNTETVKASIAYTSPYEGFSVTGYNDGNGTTGEHAFTAISDGLWQLTLGDFITTVTVTPAGQDLWGEMFSGRDGSTAEKAYLITTTDGLDLLAKKVNGTDGYTVNNYSGKFFELGENIEYDNTQGNNYTAIGYLTTTAYNHHFDGIFDGKGHTVSGIRINADTGNQGLFGYIKGATVKNLTIDDATIGSGNYRVGGIAGYGANSTIENCHATSTVAAHSNEVGGIVGRISGGTISGCTSAATVTGTSSVGAIVGYNLNATIENCLVLGATVSGTSNVGAIVGNNSGTLTNNRYTVGTKVNGSTESGHGTGNRGDITDNGGATVAISSTNVPDGIGDAGTAYAAGTTYEGITPYTNGLYYKGHYYWHEELSSFELDNSSSNNNSIIYENSGNRFNVILSGRTLDKDGKWNTICLPFDVDMTDPACPLYGATYRTVTDASISGTTLNLTFAEKRYTSWADNTLKAGVPYIIKWDKAADYVDDDAHNIVNPVFTNVTVRNVGVDFWNVDGSISNSTVAFRGTYNAKTDIANNYGYNSTKLFDVLLLGDDNKLHYATTGANLGACRAFFLVDPDAVDPAAGARLASFNIDFGDDENETTGIISIDNGQCKIDNSVGTGWYTLDGRKLQGKPTKKGLYIVNGRKVVVK